LITSMVPIPDRRIVVDCDGDSSSCSSDVVAFCPKRSIQWKDEICEYHEGAVLDTDASRRDIWYQHSELSRIKRKALVISKEANQYGFGSLLTNTYGRAGDEMQDALNTWSRNGNSRRGLERWINDEYAAKRSDIRRRTIQSVLRAQTKLREEAINNVDYGIKVISRLSEAFSVDSRNFAYAMAIADEVAMSHVEEDYSIVQERKAKALAQQQHMAAAPPRLPQRTRGLSLTEPPEESFRHFY
jgi:hypothetical protein